MKAATHESKFTILSIEHYRIIFVWSDDRESLKRMKNDVGSRLALMVAKPRHNTADTECPVHNLWLPVSKLFNSVLTRIQVVMLQKGIEQLSAPDFIPDGSNAVHITVLIIVIIEYFTTPTVPNRIIQAGDCAGNYGRNIAQRKALQQVPQVAIYNDRYLKSLSPKQLRKGTYCKTKIN